MSANDLLKSAWVFTVCTALLPFVGCAHCPTNARLTRDDLTGGYRYQNLSHEGNSDSLLVILTFSGGGTRAAALAYGVLEKLAQTDIVWEGQRRRLLDEVDLISSVSGGSFTGAYYALFGDRIFQDFEASFLKLDIESRVWRLYWSPLNWMRLASPYYDRIDLFAEYFDQHLFDRRTFGDLLQRGRRPFLMINATDMVPGSRFEFTQDQFDLICSELAGVPVARAVAASTAIPVWLSPMTLMNYSGSRDHPEPEWITEALADGEASARRRYRALEARSYLSATNRPFIHLLDGGLADNLGLRGPLEAVITHDANGRAMRLFELERVRKVVLIVVDAHVAPDNELDRREKAPGVLDVMRASSRVPMSRYSIETVELFKETLKSWAQDDATRRAAATHIQSNVPGNRAQPMRGELEFYPVEVNFDALSDEAERRFFKSIPTSFNLSAETVDRLRTVAAKLLQDSGSYQKLLRDLNGNQPSAPPNEPDHGRAPGDTPILKPAR